MAGKAHFNQSVLLACDGVEKHLLEKAVSALLEHHDALRMRFCRDGNGDWQQENAADENVSQAFSEVDLRHVDEAKQREELERSLGQWQASLDLENGPLLRVVLYQLAGTPGQRILIVIHHLVVDGVSWRILLKDLELGYRQLQKGEEPHWEGKQLPSSSGRRRWKRLPVPRN